MAKARAGHAHRRWRLSGKKAVIDHVRNDINVTPLVDVMLVLLIIFMLMSMLMTRGQEVKLPRARNISSQPDLLQPIVSIDEKGTLFVEKAKLGEISDRTMVEMKDRIEAVWAKKPRGNGHVYVKAHPDITYGQIYPVLFHLNRDLILTSIDLAVAESGKD